MMNILISNRQKVGRPDIPRLRRLTLFCMNRVRRNNPRRRWGDLSLVLTDDAGIMRINRLYLDREGATDVITFAWPSVPRGKGPRLRRPGYTGRRRAVAALCRAAKAEALRPGEGLRRGECYGGELFVNVQRARDVGRGDIDKELALYIAHACDHVSGASDRSPQGRRRMRARELRWLREAAKLNLLHGLLAFARVPRGVLRGASLDV